jgi:hypothetical protein
MAAPALAAYEYKADKPELNLWDAFAIKEFSVFLFTSPA